MRVLRAASRVSSRRCDRIVFVSDDSARWIGDRLGIPQERRVVIPHGVDLAAWSRPPGPRTHRAVRRPYILSVSSIYRYKNFVRLIEAYGVLGRHREALPDLVIIGDVQDAMHSAEMQRARAATGDLAERIHLLGEVPRRVLRRGGVRARVGARAPVMPMTMSPARLPRESDRSVGDHVQLGHPREVLRVSRHQTRACDHAGGRDQEIHRRDELP